MKNSFYKTDQSLRKDITKLSKLFTNTFIQITKSLFKAHEAISQTTQNNPETLKKLKNWNEEVVDSCRTFRKRFSRLLGDLRYFVNLNENQFNVIKSISEELKNTEINLAPEFLKQEIFEISNICELELPESLLNPSNLVQKSKITTPSKFLRTRDRRGTITSSSRYGKENVNDSNLKYKGSLSSSVYRRASMGISKVEMHKDYIVEHIQIGGSSCKKIIIPPENLKESMMGSYRALGTLGLKGSQQIGSTARGKCSPLGSMGKRTDRSYLAKPRVLFGEENKVARRDPNLTHRVGSTQQSLYGAKASLSARGSRYSRNRSQGALNGKSSARNSGRKSSGRRGSFKSPVFIVESKVLDEQSNFSQTPSSLVQSRTINPMIPNANDSKPPINKAEKQKPQLESRASSIEERHPFQKLEKLKMVDNGSSNNTKRSTGRSTARASKVETNPKYPPANNFSFNKPTIGSRESTIRAKYNQIDANKIKKVEHVETISAPQSITVKNDDSVNFTDYCQEESEEDELNTFVKLSSMKHSQEKRFGFTSQDFEDDKYESRAEDYETDFNSNAGYDMMVAAVRQQEIMGTGDMDIHSIRKHHGKKLFKGDFGEWVSWRFIGI
jgi:hypothetical protein